MRSSQVTIKDIARELGISPSTVSRALKDHPDISKARKELVKEMAEKLNYQPNTIAMGLRQNKTNTIGIIVPEIVHFFFSTVISGIEDIAYSKGYSVIISQSNEKYEKEVIDIKALFNHRVDGMLMSVSKETQDIEHIKATLDRGVPLVFFDRAIEQLPCSRVVVDDFKGGYEMTKHLIDQGYTRIAHLAGPPNLEISQRRLEGYKKALIDHGLGIDDKLIWFEEEPTTEIYSRELTWKLLGLRDKPQAIFANNDMAALGALSVAKEMGLKVPDDVAIAGFSNWDFTQLTEPPLTTVDQPGYKLGQEAARLLIREIEAEEDEYIEPETIILDTSIIVRESTRPKVNVG